MTAPDRRVANAREYLDAIRPYKVSGRPLSVLRRECQELRRQLGQVLHVIEHQAPEVCDDHQADLDAVDAYRAVAREIGGWK